MMGVFFIFVFRSALWRCWGGRLRDWTWVDETGFHVIYQRRLLVLVWLKVVQWQLSSTRVIQMKTLPIQKLAESLRSVSLDNSLSSCETTEAKHVLRKFINWFFGRFEASIHQINTIWGWICHVFRHESTETWQIGGHRRDSHHGTLSRCVAPRLVIGRKHS